ncbi:hypothetical protein FGG08_005263 [Glutinoglossum americanum]|uniref:Pleckstrin homology domain-containing protein n=1 Tax=Glutinoglossum americanum TaxID=1670608 RepID=A0A9P8I3B3_9PEZI|nr:hypothetical protein FGG08_005263 [Glutinoglossum americanum]
MAFPDYGEYAFSDHALPAPTDTPYRAPSRSASRRSSRQSASSPGPSQSPPPPMPPAGSNGRYSPTTNPDPANDENISILDPRRFTPTLHANLVSEILSLRRDLDSKNSVIEGLENNLHGTRDELEKLNETLSGNSKETRSLRRQLQLLEGGTSSALGELAKERDEAVENTTEIKRRLEISQKKIRIQEEDADRFQTLWQRDKDNWDNEKRNLERKVHVVEGRLKAILDEVAAHQAASQPDVNNVTHLDSETEDEAKENGTGHGSDTASIRSTSARRRRPASSMYSDDGVRLSMLSGPNGYGGAKFNGLSLADELDFDETEEEQPNGSGDERDGAPPHDARTSAIRHEPPKPEDHITPTMELPAVNGEALAALEAAAEPSLTEVFPRPPSANGQITAIKVDYVDTGVQYSPPPSPQLQAPGLDSQKVDKPEGRAATPTRESDHEANQRRKRVSINTAIPPNCQIPAIIIPSSMVSNSSQTLDGPLSPPRTPKSPTRSPPSTPSPEISMTSIGTQTDAVEQPKSKRAPPPPPIPIPVPSITIHPPTSAPTTPGLCMLPPNTKNASCQVSMKSMIKLRSISMQTEEIRIDNRPVQLPAHLLPSAISSHPPTPEPGEDPRSAPVPPPKNLRRGLVNRQSPDPPSSPPLPSPTSHGETQDAYPGNNDNGPLGDDRATGIRRPFRSSSLFAGFEVPSSDDADEFGEPDLSDSDYRTALSAPKPRTNSKKHGKLVSRPPKSVPEDTEPNEESDPELPVGTKKQSGTVPNVSSTISNAQPILGRRKSPERGHKAGFRRLDKPLTLNTKQPNIRKSAMISSGTAAHTQQVRSVGLENAPVFRELGPPFPVPTRASSRNKPFSVSDGTRSPTPQSSTYSSHRRRDDGRQMVKRNSLRKVRSAAALPRSGRRRSGSPPPLSTSSAAPDSPQLPPMPRDDITAPRYMQERHRYGHSVHHRHHPSTNTSNTGGASVGSSIQQVSVVDAIAQTMVGEWMWKYVRRRKSFGVPESPQTGWEAGRMGDDVSANISSNGIRHKRWVWLAPYERCVMWSSRQPTNGTALLGKTGRKLAIQSVLDVKDDTPMPKNSGSQPLFNRSILILTPARALKFTATTKERHFLWLTALSFLSHSSQGANELVSLPPIPSQEYEPPRPQQARLHRPIRDSIRVAKSKGRPLASATNSSYGGSYASQQESIPEGCMGFAGDGPIATAADPPNVPRFSSHGRKRSNTGSRMPPPGAFRSFSHNPVPSSNFSVNTNASSDFYGNGSMSGFGPLSGNTSFSRRTSDVSGPSVTPSNFFDAVGTVRMEAFVERSRFDMDEPDGYPGPSSYRLRRDRKRESYYSGSTDYYGNRTEDIDEFFRADDPFRGF